MINTPTEGYSPKLICEDPVNGILIAGFMGRSARRAWETLWPYIKNERHWRALTISNALRELRGSDARKSS
jgi:hypothetical protein